MRQGMSKRIEHRRAGLLVLSICLLNIISCLLFLEGFLDISSSSHNAKQSDIELHHLPAGGWDNLGEGKQVQSGLDRLVIVLIDALRADFLFGDPKTSIGFLQRKLADGEARGFVSKAATPTVTLPRLKALLSGRIPSFKDLLFNFGSPEFDGDNVVDRLVQSGHKIVFYGDDTWMELFPGRFHRFEAVSSFFASDYIEVDLNVTRNVRKELVRDDWDVMITHYLGLDHIGHSVGPQHPALAYKLREMSDVLEEIYSKISSLPGRSMLVVLGDHGMTESGSHGGSSPLEVDTGLAFVSPQFLRSPVESPSPVSTVEQTDFASTIAILEGIGVPVSSIGQPILSLLRHFFSDSELARSYCDLTRTAVKLLSTTEYDSLPSTNFLDSVNGDCDRDEGSLNLQTLVTIHSKISDILSARKATYKDTLMIAGMLGVTLCVLLGLRTLRSVSLVSGISRVDAFCILCTVFHGVSKASSSFVEEEHFLWYMWISCASVGIFLTLCLRDPKLVILGLTLVIMQRIAKDWNQTGDKYREVPDIGDWLRMPEHSWVLTALLVAAFTAQSYIVRHDLPSVVAFALVLAHRMLLIDQLAWVVYAYVCIRFIFEVQRLGQSNLASFKFLIIVLGTLICKAHNVSLICMIQVYERALTRILCANKVPFHLVTLIYLVASWAFFFAFGNSNAISSIDVSTGFVGIPFYCAPVHGLLITLHSYWSPIYWFLSWCEISERWHPMQRLASVVLCAVIRMSFLCCAMVISFVQRYHIFIWSVFAPHVLFEIAHFFLCFIMIVCFLSSPSWCKYLDK